MWANILTKASNLLPDFNTYLINEFRKDKIEKIKFFLDQLFAESVRKFDGRLSYLGYKVLTPQEQIQYIRNNKIIHKKVQILDSTFELIRYTYEFRGEKQHIHVFVPYMVDDRILLNDTEYWPLLPEIECGGLHRTHTEIILKVMGAPITMYRNEIVSFTTSKGITFKEIVNQVRIHQGRRGRSKNSGKVPFILYHLVHMPFHQCMAYYKFQPGEIDIVPTYDESLDKAGFSHIKIKENVFIKVSDSALEDMYKRRVIASYITCLNEWNHFMLRDLLSNSCEYYKSVLGRYTYSQIVGSDSAKALMYSENAIKHLKTTNSILDPPAILQLSHIGINVENIYDFLYIAFYNMDSWMVGYNPCDLYDKKIGSLDSIMSPLVSAINKKLFSIVNAKEEELNQSSVKSMISRASQLPNWISSNPAFRPNPSFCNDNKMITIMTKRFRSLENVETSGGTKSKSKNMTVSLLKAHPSQLVVESICSIPPSSPIITMGNIRVIVY